MNWASAEDSPLSTKSCEIKGKAPELSAVIKTACAPVSRAVRTKTGAAETTPFCENS